MAPPACAAPTNPKINPRTVGGPAMQAPTSKRQGLRENISPFRNFIVGASIARPRVPPAGPCVFPRSLHRTPRPCRSANPQISPAPLAGLPCRPLQAKGRACVKNIAISKFHRRGEHCSPAKALCCRKAPRVEQSPTPTMHRERVRLNSIAISQFRRRGGAWLRPPLPGTGPCVLPACPPINPVLRFLFANIRSATHCGVISPESKPK